MTASQAREITLSARRPAIEIIERLLPRVFRQIHLAASNGKRQLSDTDLMEGWSDAEETFCDGVMKHLVDRFGYRIREEYSLSSVPGSLQKNLYIEW